MKQKTKGRRFSPEQRIERLLKQGHRLIKKNPRESLQLFKEAEKAARELVNERADEASLDLLTDSLDAELTIYAEYDLSDELVKTIDEIYRVGQRRILKNPHPANYYVEAMRILMLEKVIKGLEIERDMSMIERAIFYMRQAIQKEFTLEGYLLLDNLYWLKFKWLREANEQKKEEMAAFLTEFMEAGALSSTLAIINHLDADEIGKLADNLEQDASAAAIYASMQMDDYDLAEEIFTKGIAQQVLLQKYEEGMQIYLFNILGLAGNWAAVAKNKGKLEEREKLMDLIFGEIEKFIHYLREIKWTEDQELSGPFEDVMNTVLEIAYEKEDQQKEKWLSHKHKLLDQLKAFE